MIIKLRPEWAGSKLTKDGKDIGWNHEDGAIRIVMTGTASDRPGLQDHVIMFTARGRRNGWRSD